MPGPEKIEASRKALASKFDEEDVEYLLATEREQWAMHNTATYLDLGTSDAEPGAESLSGARIGLAGSSSA